MKNKDGLTIGEIKHKERALKKISDILYEHGENLSDGYGYYCDDEEAEIREIAEEVFEAIKGLRGQKE